MWLRGYLNRDWWYSTLGLNLVSKNIPLLAIAVGRSWGFQILHGHTHRKGGSGAETHSCVTLSCSSILPCHALRFFLLFLSLSLHALGFCGSLTLGKSPRGNRVLCSEVQFLKSTLMRISWNVKLKSTRIINSGGLLVFRVWHIRDSQKT